MQAGANRRELCWRSGISSTTGYRWVARTDPDLEARILTLRDAQPIWGACKLPSNLRRARQLAPATSTITAILHRHDRIDPDHPRTTPWTRFEYPDPNDLWQMDFMGYHPLRTGRVHPLTVIDDHSRFGLVLTACSHERGTLVRPHLTRCFERYSLAWAILTDNGPPWRSPYRTVLTGFDVRLMRLGIEVIHGRSLHPQTQGKIER